MTIVWAILLVVLAAHQAYAVYGSKGRRAPAATLYVGLLGAAPFVVLSVLSSGDSDLLWAGALIGFATGTAVGEVVGILQTTGTSTGRRVALGIEVTPRDYLGSIGLAVLRLTPAIVVATSVAVFLLVRMPGRHIDEGLSIGLPVAVGSTVATLIAWICAEIGVRAAVDHPLHADSPDALRSANVDRADSLARFTSIVPGFALASVVLWLAYATEALLKANPAPYPADAQAAGFAILCLCLAVGTALVTGMFLVDRERKRTVDLVPAR